jgi:hypothetical protein
MTLAGLAAAQLRDQAARADRGRSAMEGIGRIAARTAAEKIR